MGTGRLCFTLVVGGLVLVLCAIPAEAQKTWVGDTEEWNDILHWAPNGVPGPNDDVVHTWNQGVHGVLMDVPTVNGVFNPYKVQEFRLDVDWDSATEQGVLTLMSQFCREQDPPCNDESIMSFVGGMDGSGTAQDPLDPNLYRIRLGIEDRVYVGDVFTADHPGGAIEYTTHFEWELNGIGALEPWVIASAGIGPGRWTVNAGQVHTGFAVNPEGDLVDMATFPGVIDSEVTEPVFSYLDPNYNGESMWRIDGIDLWSKQIRNLDYWRVTRENGVDNGIGSKRYMEIRAMTFEDEPLDGIAPANLWAQSQSTDPREERGMRIIQLLEMWSHDPANVIGPNALAEELIVERDDEQGSPEPILSIRHGVFFDVNQDEPGAVTYPEFRYASSLRYGPPSGQRPEPFDPWESLNRTTFTVQNPAGASPTPVLLFRDDSYITAIDPDAITPSENDLLIQSFRTSIDIESTVSALPARDWYTGDTDLFIRKSSEVTLEAIAEDNCNLWFEDVPEPRCQKYWRNLFLRGALLTLVDDDDNHVCGPQPPAPMDGAMYVLEDVGSADDPSTSTIDLNGVNLYYGGAIVNGLSFTGGTPIAFKKTIYGDFDGNCYVSGNDVTILSNFLGGAVSRCDWPAADWNGDCVIDLVDLTEVMNRSGVPISNPNCNPLQAIVCPTQQLLGGDGGGGAPPSAETVALFSDAMVDFIARQDPVGENETSEVTAAVTSLGHIALTSFSPEQRTTLAEALEAARGRYRNETILRLADGLARSLNQ